MLSVAAATEEMWQAAQSAEQNTPDHLQHATTTERAVAKGPKTSPVSSRQQAAGSSARHVDDVAVGSS